MKRFLFILFGWLLGISTMQSQSILRYRYWYDNDVSDIQSGLLDDGNLILDVNGLEDGLHNLYVVLEGDALMTPQRYMFVKVAPPSQTPTAELKYRYWYDNDVSNIQTGLLGDGILLLNVNGLEDGQHNLYVMLEGDALMTPQRYMFVKVAPPSQTPTAELKYRYWYDNDVSNIQTGLVGDGILLLDVNDLEDGLHNLYVALEGDALMTPQRYMFVKVAPPSQTPTAELKYRYWFDNDVSNIQTGLLGDGILLLDVNDLEDGLHNLYVMLEGESLMAPQRYMFVKMSPQVLPPTTELKYRYWFDNDVTNIQTGLLGDGILLLNVNGLEDGLHNLYVMLEGDALMTPQRYMFVKMTSQLPPPTVELKYRYWFDDNVSDIQTGLLGNGSLLLDANALEDGDHTLHIMLEGNCLMLPQSYDFTKDDSIPSFYAITATVSPLEGGSVTGMGTYLEGQTCTLTATSNVGYIFESWTKNGNIVSTNPTYSFTVTESAIYTAHFVQQVINTYYVGVSVNPADGGTVSGGGSYNQGSTCTLTATPAEGYFFLNWTHNGTVVSTNPTYSFTVTGNANYVANFSFGLPELHVTGISHSTLVAGQQATISWTVQNDGTAATPNGALWHDRVWLSVESRVAADDNNPILLGTFDNLSALALGEYYTQTQTFNIPIDIVGEYYLFVLTDAYDCHTIYWDSTGVQLPYNPPPYIGCLSHHCYSCPNYADNRIYEQSEYAHGEAPGGYYNDNFFYELVDIEVPILPDLQVTSIIPQTNFFSGSMVNVTATINNLGENTTLTDHWADALYIASEPDFNSSSTVCLAVVPHSGQLPVGQSYQVQFAGQVPLTMYGEAYFFVYTDCYEQVYEHVLNHNNITMSEAVNVILSPPSDLEPSDLTVPATVSTGEAFAYSYKVNNIGAGNPNVNNWVDKIYLCQNADALDASAILLKTVNHYGGLQSGANYSVSESMVLPSNVSSGTYYLYVHADANNAVFEYLYDGNNLARSNAIIILRPDLQVTQISAPEQITAGYPLNLSYTLTNTGEGAVSNKMITDRIYISASGNMTDTIRVANNRRNVSLPSGQSLTVMCNDLAPYHLTDGTNHLLVVTDFGNEINESNEGNNTLSYYPISVFHQPLPDLQPVSLTISAVIQAGGTIPIEFDITNIGDLDLLNSNCTFNIYAAWGDNEILCPVQSQTLPLGSNVSIGIGQTVHFVRSVLVPPTVTSACSTFELIANKGGLVPELDTTNNVYTATATVLDCPLPDLVVTNITATAIQSGVENQISFIVSNVGTADFEGSFNTMVYVRSVTDTILCPLVLQVSPEANNYTIPIGGTLSFTQKVLVPPMANASCNLLDIIVDEENQILETNDDNNATSSAVTVINYPFDLKTTTLQVPESVWAGETTTLSWTVKNIGTCPSESIPLYVKKNGTYTLVQGEILPQPWMDKVFVSIDAVLSDDDIELCSVARSTVLQPNGTYSVEQSVTLPYSHLGAQYLLCVSDATRVTYDSDTLNNVKAIPIEVQLGSLPDLRITSLTVEEELTSDQAYWVHYTVVNEGERVTQKENWTDAFFIGEAMTYLGALQMGSKIHHGALEVGESYTDSIEILIPNGLEGDYFLIGFTDRTNQIFEHDNEDDNVLAISVTVTAPLPCDLIAVQPDFPASVISGEEMTVSWQLRNIGYNPAVGRIRNAVYLSRDDAWSSDDVMLGYADMNVNIVSNAQQPCSLSSVLTNVPEGHYYVIVRANILNALNESSYENNICVSMLTTEVGYPTLAIGEQVDRTLAADQYIYYKLVVGPEYEGQTLSCTLTTAEQQVANGLYLSHETVPSMTQYDFGQYVPYTQDINVLIPVLEQGVYYLLAKGTTQSGNPQQVSIATSVINFEILSIDADHGANTGSITTKITGAKFDSIMDFRLVKDGDYLPAEKVFFSNSTETYTTFDLAEMPLGVYAMEAELPGGIITIKDGAFTIEEGLPAELAINIVAPASVRSGNTFVVNIEYGNIGTTDLNVSGFVVVSRNGHPIGFTTEELQESQTELTFYTAESNGNPDVLRPGYLGTKAIMVMAIPATNVSLAVFAIRRQY